jgi:hypothetical protein
VHEAPVADWLWACDRAWFSVRHRCAQRHLLLGQKTSRDEIDALRRGTFYNLCTTWRIGDCGIICICTRKGFDCIRLGIDLPFLDNSDRVLVLHGEHGIRVQEQRRGTRWTNWATQVRSRRLFGRLGIGKTSFSPFVTPLSQFNNKDIYIYLCRILFCTPPDLPTSRLASPPACPCQTPPARDVIFFACDVKNLGSGRHTPVVLAPSDVIFCMPVT